MMINIVICGTPGTGKSLLIENLKPLLPDFNVVNVSKFAIENNCIDSYDPILETQVIDEDRLENLLLPFLKEKKHNLIESIHGDILPISIINHVFVCRTDNTILFRRLEARNYNETKIKNNVEAEIFQTILDETLQCFDSSSVNQLINNDEADLNKNLQSISEIVTELLKR